MTHLALCWSVVAMTACGSTPPAPANRPEPVAISDAAPDAGAADPPIDASSAPVVAAPPVDAGAAAPVITPVAIPAALQLPPAVKGKASALAVKKTAKLGGVAITFTGNSHKQRIGGPVIGMYSFVLAKGAAKTEVELRGEDPGFQAEVVAHGMVFVFEHVTYDEFSVVHFPGRARDLGEEGCVDRIDAAAKVAGLAEGGDTAYGTDYGILSLVRPTWTASCGRYTGRVWFGPRRSADGDATL